MRWHVQYPGQKNSVVVTYSSASARNKKQYSGASIISSLTKYNNHKAPYMVSTITLMMVRQFSIHGTQVKCTVDGLVYHDKVKIGHHSLNKGSYNNSQCRTFAA